MQNVKGRQNGKVVQKVVFSAKSRKTPFLGLFLNAFF